mgnify:CR=1 FL=1
MYTTEELTARWEDQRAIKNLMGKYANCVILNREQDIYGLFWSGREDVSLMFNDGAYQGAEAVSAYYQACHDRNALVAKLMQARFPEVLGGKSPEEIYGVGPFKVKPMACPVIEVAGDGRTAKGLWYCIGQESVPGRAMWVTGKVAMDFVKEGDAWKIWHVVEANDLSGEAGEAYSAGEPYWDPASDPVALAFGTPDVAVLTHDPNFNWWDDYPAMPRPYDTFTDELSYGPEGFRPPRNKGLGAKEGRNYK